MSLAWPVYDKTCVHMCTSSQYHQPLAEFLPITLIINKHVSKKTLPVIGLLVLQQAAAPWLQVLVPLGNIL